MLSKISSCNYRTIKRGSLIINQKIAIANDNNDLINFTSNFKKEILKK